MAASKHAPLILHHFACLALQLIGCAAEAVDVASAFDVCLSAAVLAVAVGGRGRELCVCCTVVVGSCSCVPFHVLLVLCIYPLPCISLPFSPTEIYCCRSGQQVKDGAD
jgi:hypothetical protein